MAILRIAFATAIVIYAAPHMGVHLWQDAQPLIADAGHALVSEISTDTTTRTVLAYCQKNPDTCARIARLAVNGASSEIPSQDAPTQLALRSTLPGTVPMPPARPLAQPHGLRPALRQ